MSGSSGGWSYLGLDLYIIILGLSLSRVKYPLRYPNKIVTLLYTGSLNVLSMEIVLK